LIIAKFALGFTTSINTILAKNPKTMDGKKLSFIGKIMGLLEIKKKLFLGLNMFCNY